jgi:hypothetical protein
MFLAEGDSKVLIMVFERQSGPEQCLTVSKPLLSQKRRFSIYLACGSARGHELHRRKSLERFGTQKKAYPLSDPSSRFRV